MDLFIMRRYDGDEEPKKHTSREDHLASLLSKIERRKKLQVKLTKDEVKETPASLEERPLPDESNDTEIRNKKSKQRKRECEGELEDDFSKDVTEKLLKRKKKKIQNMSEVLHLDDPENDSPSEVDADGPSKVDGFTIIQNDPFLKRSKVKGVLPHWLANPVVLSRNLSDLTKTIYDIPNLDDDLLEKLKENNISHFFPVQCEVIPWLLNAHKKPVRYRPNDICVSAPTGSGKTLAYVLPIVQTLKSRVMRHIRALIVLPVKELASQVYNVFMNYCQGTDLEVILLIGQKSFVDEQKKITKQNAIIGVYNAVDIVVTTPGRLVEHLLKTPGFSLKYLRFLIIDEADRILEDNERDLAWLHQVEKHMYGDIQGKCIPLSISSLAAKIPPPPQKLLFSATLSQDPERLKKLGLFQPKCFTAAGERNNEYTDGAALHRKYTTPMELTEKFCVIEEQVKPLVLYHLIMTVKWNRVLCFMRSLEEAHRLAILMKILGKGSLKIGEMSSALKHERVKMLRKFTVGKINLLITTDVMARGIDLPEVDYVISYNVPMFVKIYIHRIGRTARAGRKGTAVTFLQMEELGKFHNLLYQSGKENGIEELSIDTSDLEYLENDYKEALTDLQRTLSWENRKRKF